MLVNFEDFRLKTRLPGGLLTLRCPLEISNAVAMIYEVTLVLNQVHMSIITLPLGLASLWTDLSLQLIMICLINVNPHQSLVSGSVFEVRDYCSLREIKRVAL